jgi:uncharacterized protein
MKWRKLNGDIIAQPIKEAVRETILRERAAGHKLKVCIGTDSQVHADSIEFATVILFLREKKGGFMYINTDRSTNMYMSLRERMITEVGKSVEIAYALCEVLDTHNVELEVHADINTDPHFQSNVAFRDAMGYIMGMGFVFKAKPDAIAASCCADKVL